MRELTLTTKEQARIQVLNAVKAGEVTVEQAAGLMEVSERHTWRLLAAYGKEGAAAIAHGNRGRRPSTTTDADTQQRVRELAKGLYAGFNHTHLTEMLAQNEGIDLSRSTVRRILLAAGVRSPRRRKSSRRYSRRERYPKEGMLLQVDGSQHDWLQGRGPRMTLVGAVDDATGTVPAALFRQHEDTQGYMMMLREVIDRHGVPGALYSDRHGIFQRSPKEPDSIDEQLRGKRDRTQFGRVLEELGIGLVMAHTPQAKGRVERAWGTFQDRLVSEMRLAGVSTIEQANRALADFIPRYNRKFGVRAAQPGTAYRRLPSGVCLDAVLCFKYIRTVANDNTVSFGGSTLQLLANEHRANYIRAKVEVQERLDGSIVVVHQGRTLATGPAPLGPVELRARGGPRSNGAHSHAVGAERRNGAKGLQRVSDKPSPTPKRRSKKPYKPAPDHPWRRKLLT